MKALIRMFARLATDEKGATAMEYGLLAAVIAVAILTGATSAGTALNTLFTDIGVKLTTVAGTIN